MSVILVREKEQKQKLSDSFQRIFSDKFNDKL